MKKRKILNICMVAVVLFTLLCGVMAVGSVKGWFHSQDSNLSVSEKIGIVSVERKGISYELQSGDRIKSGDIICTNETASINILEGEIPRLALSGNTKSCIENNEDEFQVHVIQGEVFLDARGVERKYTFLVENETVTTRSAALSVSVQKGAQTIYVFSGNVSVTGTEDISAKAGDVISIAENSKEITVSKDVMMIQSLNDFQIRALKKCELDHSFCFSLADIEEVEKAREEESQNVQQAQLLQNDSEADLITGTEDVTDSKKLNSSKQDNSSNGTSTEKEDGSSQESTLGDTKNESTQNGADNSLKYCTIEIRCDTILSNMKKLASGKEGYVPSNGTILATSKIEFTDGETVFDVLKRACELTGIQLEYSYIPLYESYYIEGINYIYEFDCGDQSGWMYKVNGWFPNYGCSSYKVKDGDVIVWCYTCNGLGADVGGSIY